ncbi:MAG: hypothetical protein J6C96_07820 [Oscillospiraceae bacterium]|nr:hypothetical protein [Oscillospiraceae bacterium]
MLGSERRSGMKGTVLIMILTVMFVLIIMLMATLTVVTTANQRVYTKYEENQAYYTARSALDVYTMQMMSDDKYFAYDDSGAIRKFTYTDTTLATPAPASVDMKQGLALQLDLYKIKSQGLYAAEKYGSDAALDFAENALNGDGTFISASPEETNYTMDSTGGLPYIEYDVRLPAVSKGSDQYAKMVDTDVNDEDGDGDTTDQIARIRVEVLDRIYATDPHYDADAIKTVIDNAVPADIASLQTAIQNGDRSKDYMKIKVTSTVKLMDVESVAVVVFETQEIDAPDTSNAINSLGGLTGSGAGLVAAGGASSLSTGNITIDASGTAGSIFALGNLEWNSSGSCAFDDGASVYARGGVKFTNSQNITAVGQDSYIYTEGLCDIVSSFNYGTTENPMSIICDEFKYNNGIDVKGNIYTNKMHVGGSNGYQTVGSDAKVYAKDVYFPTGVVSVNNVTKTVTISNCLNSNLVAYGDIYVGDDITGYQNCSTLYSGYTITGVNKTTGTFDLFNKVASEKDDKIQLAVKLPAALPSNSTDTIYLETTQSRFSSYFEDSSFDANGELIDGYDVSNIKSKIISAEKSYYTTTKQDVPDVPTLNIYTDNITSSTITSNESGVLSVGGNYIVDTGSGDVTIQLVNGVDYSGSIEVKGTGNLFVLMPELSTAGNYNFNNFKIYTENITSTAGQKIENGKTKAAKIHYFVGDNANITMSNNNFFAGYFYMPLSKMTNSSGNNGISKEYHYNGTTTTKNYFIVGSITCADYDTGGSNSGVCYLDPSSGASTPGEPHLSVKASQYTRK